MCRSGKAEDTPRTSWFKSRDDETSHRASGGRRLSGSSATGTTDGEGDISGERLGRFGFGISRPSGQRRAQLRRCNGR